MEMTDVTVHVGTEVAGISLNSATDDEIETLKHLVAERGVLFFRRQDMTLAEHVELGRRFGPLHFHPAADSAPGHPGAMRVFTEPDSVSVAGETWHTDVSCDEAPPALSILHMADVPKTGGDTAWASTYLAYETLSVPIQQLIEGLKARHSSAHHYDRRYGTAAEGNTYPEAVHPVVATHPISGRRALYVNSVFTSSILGLTSFESEALLKMLLDHVAYGVDFQVRLRWEPDTVAIWDNRCTQHHATWDYFPEPRRGHRVTTKGERPVLVP
jgi:taurine dioxygenase